MLDKIYGFKDYRVADAGGWMIEQYRDADMTYTCHAFPDGTASVFVSTNDNFPKEVSFFNVDKEGHEICRKKAI